LNNYKKRQKFKNLIKIIIYRNKQKMESKIGEKRYCEEVGEESNKVYLGATSTFDTPFDLTGPDLVVPSSTLVSPIDLSIEETVSSGAAACVSMDEVKEPEPESPLLRDGYMLIDCREALSRVGFTGEEFRHNLREFKDPNGPINIGGFGAIGGASQVHQPLARRLRLHVVQCIRKYLRMGLKGEYYVANMLDRFSLRIGGSSTTAENWHRDTSMDYSDGLSMDDFIVGGWFNLNSPDDGAAGSQFFTCVPGTQFEPDPGCGFKRLSKEAAAEYRTRSVRVEVPQGFALVFLETLVHCVTQAVTPLGLVNRGSLRCYLKARLSRTVPANFPHEEVMQTITTQGNPRLNSKENGFPSYSHMHLMVHRERLMEFSENVHDQFRDVMREIGTREPILDEDGNAQPGFVRRYMQSLSEAGLMFEPYTQEEIDLLMPTPL